MDKLEEDTGLSVFGLSKTQASVTLSGKKSDVQKYSEKDFLGKTSTQIVEEYGEFDCVSAPADADGIYRSCRCGYTVQKARPGYLEQNPEILFFIYFL